MLIGPAATATRTAWRPRWVLAFLAAAVAVLVAVFGAAPASAVTASTTQNGAGASTSAGQVVVGASAGVVAGQRLGNGPPRAQVVVATGVAAETAGAAETAAATDAAPELGQYVYRVHGGESGQWGHSWTPENPMGMANPRSSLGLPKVNSGQLLTRARVQRMEGVVGRSALELDGNPGGAEEWLFPEPVSQREEHWTIPLVPPW